MDNARKQQLVNLLKNPVFTIDTPDDEALLRYDQALTHSSWASEQKQAGNPCEDYERLEFLGDCILDFIIAEELYTSFKTRAPELHRRFPDKTDESLLTDMLHDITNDKKIAEIVVAHPVFEESIRRGLGQESNDSIRAGSFEAFVAAVYCHAGIGAARHLVQQLFKDKIERAEPIVSWKNKLQECVQKRFQPHDVRQILRYHEPVLDSMSAQLCVRVSVNGEIWGEGRADCKRDAEVEAAKDACQHHCMNAIRYQS